MFAEKTGTKWTILKVLREDGSVSVKQLQDEVDVNASTINEHLSDLRGMGLVDKRSEKHGPGRPKHVYFLTEQAEHLFPHAYAELASMLIDVIRSLAGEPNFREKISRAIRSHLDQYENLESALNALGFYPEFEDIEEGEQLVYHQCPFHDVAKEQPALCEIDREILEDVTQKDAEMEASIAAGDHQCKFILTEN
jgi:DeoR family suf operon transcriptional repressor